MLAGRNCGRTIKFDTKGQNGHALANFRYRPKADITQPLLSLSVQIIDEDLAFHTLEAFLSKVPAIVKPFGRTP